MGPGCRGFGPGEVAFPASNAALRVSSLVNTSHNLQRLVFHQTRNAWIDQQMRAASRPPVRLMRDTIITGIGAGLATSLCGVLIRGLGWLLNFTIFGTG